MALKECAGFGGVSAGSIGHSRRWASTRPALLKVGKDFFRRLPCRGDAKGGEENARRAGKREPGE